MRTWARVMGVGCVVSLACSPAGWAAPETTPAHGSVDPSAVMAKPANEEPAYDFGDFTSQTLTTKAWEAFKQSDYTAAEAYASKCLELYTPQALQQAGSLTDFAPKEDAFTYWALNDVATCHFILGQVRLAQGRIEDAKRLFTTVIEQYAFAQCWDTRGWFWKVAEGASDKLTTIGTPYDFGDYTSQTLTTKAWGALAQGDHKGVELYTKKCLRLYEETAVKQQGQLTDFAPKAKAFDSWALNDVATCYFILGESLTAQQQADEAKAAFERIIDDFSYAQCWDPKGWFWKVAVGARDRLNKLLILSKPS